MKVVCRKGLQMRTSAASADILPVTPSMRYDASQHSARYTGDYVFRQLIPYIGNKRKLLGLIGEAVAATGVDARGAMFLDAFSGSGVVSRFAKRLGFAVTANDWEPYAEMLSRCYVECDRAPRFGRRDYEAVLRELNALTPVEGWVTRHLCPANDVAFDVERERMFYMRKNGMRFDAIREKIAEWEADGRLTPRAKAALLGPLLYQACWLANTSGVFKGFHRGWGGQTGTALYRIQADLELEPALFCENGREHEVLRLDAMKLAVASQTRKAYDVAYLDPPYNQHPYGSNYHVLNSLTLWDKPAFSPTITGRDKSAIRTDWRTERRSAYNHSAQAPAEYRRLVSALNARYLCTSYSTDGFIPLRTMLEANLDRGEVRLFQQSYKRYRVSAQRFSSKPMNVEFVLLTDTARRASRSADSYLDEIADAERDALAAHPEMVVIA